MRSVQPIVLTQPMAQQALLRLVHAPVALPPTVNLLLARALVLPPPQRVGRLVRLVHALAALPAQTRLPVKEGRPHGSLAVVAVVAVAVGADEVGAGGRVVRDWVRTRARSGEDGAQGVAIGAGAWRDGDAEVGVVADEVVAGGAA